VPYAYRSLDRHCLIADGRLISRPRPDLWRAHGERQVYLGTVFTQPLGRGPAAMACADIPDLHFFSGRGAKDIVPLYRDAKGTEPNILPGLPALLAAEYGCEVAPEDLLAYLYGILAHPGFTQQYASELGTRQLRVPITRDRGLFTKVRDAGARLLWLHTYGQRLIPEGRRHGEIPQGKARCTVAVPEAPGSYPDRYEYNPSTQTLHVGEGQFAPVAREVYEFDVSELKVVQSWLKYRTKGPNGQRVTGADAGAQARKRRSPLDDIGPGAWTSEFTTQLLELLWVLEATLEGYPDQAQLLSAVVEGPCFEAADLPAVPAAARVARPRDGGLFDAAEAG